MSFKALVNKQKQRRTGACGPGPARGQFSWGAACPPGDCSPQGLPAALGRQFAGEASGCRELPFVLSGAVTGGNGLVLQGNSPVTICPTRLVIETADGETMLLSQVKFGNQNQMANNGTPIPTNVFNTDAWGPIPFAMDCLRQGTPFEFVLEDASNDDTLFLMLIGPTIG